MSSISPLPLEFEVSTLSGSIHRFQFTQSIELMEFEESHPQSPQSIYSIPRSLTASELKHRIRSVDIEAKLAASNSREISSFDRSHNNSRFSQSENSPLPVNEEFDYLIDSTGRTIEPTETIDHLQINYRIHHYPVFIEFLYYFLTISFFNEKFEKFLTISRKMKILLVEFFILTISWLLLSSFAQMSFDLPNSWSETIDVKTRVPIR